VKGRLGSPSSGVPTVPSGTAGTLASLAQNRQGPSRWTLSINLQGLALAGLGKAQPLLLLLLFALPAHADDVTDKINQGLAAYSKQDYTTAATALDAASALVRTRASEMWKAFLPGAPPGWTVESTEVGAGTLGMGNSASRKYAQDAQSVTITLTTDSPVMQGLAAVLANPMIAAATGKSVMVGGRRFNYVQTDNSFVTLIADRVLLRVKGSDGISEDALKAFLALLNFPEIEKAAR
jgi:hypothetical protein